MNTATHSTILKYIEVEPCNIGILLTLSLRHSLNEGLAKK